MDVLSVGVIGAGQMGSEIALVMALAGHHVIITDADPARAGDVAARLTGLVSRAADRGLMDRDAGLAAVARIRAADIPAMAAADLVIEAVWEDFDTKAAIYRQLDGVMGPEAIIASNTSSISITSLSGVLPDARRKRFVGTHFFSPASRMRLVELIGSMDTDPAVLARVRLILEHAGKEVVPVGDVVGFAINRALHAFFIEAIRLVEEGAITPADMDRACKAGLGHPVGPFELMDGTKNDLGLQVQDILLQHYGERFRAPSLLRKMVSAGYNGRAAGRGWYRYENGRRLVAANDGGRS